MMILACNGNRTLATNICGYLNLPTVNADVRRFADSEIYVEILENVRGEDVFVVQPTAFPTNDNLMELLICLDALRRGSARRITTVIPYFGYARQDRKTGPRTPISAKLVANLLTVAGASRILTVDLHAGQIQGFFDIPTDNLIAAPLFARDIAERFDPKGSVVVSPDIGGVVRARQLAQRIGSPLAIIDKRRPKAGISEVMNVIGDVEGKACILIDDRPRRHASLRLRLARRAFRRRQGQDQPVAADFPDRHGQYRGCDCAVGKNPPRLGRAPDRRSDPADQRRALGIVAVRLTVVASRASASASICSSMSRPIITMRF
jgi:ribose-phosphate pyrophosphokinase